MTPESRAIESVLEGAIATCRVPGLAAVVVAGGAVRAVGASGLTNAKTGTPVVPETPFLWFSMTKIVTATAAMLLVEQGLLSLDDRVAGLVPGVLPPEGDELVRVRHLLQHSAGIPNPPPIRWVRPAAMPAPDPETFLRERFARVRKLRFEPGTRSAYTNVGYLLLGEVIAAAAGRPFTDFVRDEILTPLGMHATSFAPTPSVATLVATGHQRLVRGFGPLVRAILPRGIVGARAGRWLMFRPFLVNGAPYGGLVGPVTDAACLLLAHANGGKVGGTRILSEGAVREMQTISLAGRPFDHGLGWFCPPKDRDRQPSFIEYYGGGGGYYNLLRLYPGAGVGVVVMGNSTSYDVDAVTNALADPWL